MLFLNYINIAARVIISLFQTLLFVYCVASWIIRDPFDKFMQAMRSVIEPIAAPIKSILNRFRFFRECPIDFSIYFLFILCIIIQSML